MVGLILRRWGSRSLIHLCSHVSRSLVFAHRTMSSAGIPISCIYNSPASPAKRSASSFPGMLECPGIQQRVADVLSSSFSIAWIHGCHDRPPSTADNTLAESENMTTGWPSTSSFERVHYCECFGRKKRTLDRKPVGSVIGTIHHSASNAFPINRAVCE